MKSSPCSSASSWRAPSTCTKRSTERELRSATNGLANPMVSLVEDGIAGLTTLLAIVFPWVGLAFAIPAGIGLGWIYRKTSGPNDLMKQPGSAAGPTVVVSETPVGRKPKRTVNRRPRTSQPAPLFNRNLQMPNVEFKDYYEALGVDRSADEAALEDRISQGRAQTPPRCQSWRPERRGTIQGRQRSVRGTLRFRETQALRPLWRRMAAVQRSGLHR